MKRPTSKSIEKKIAPLRSGGLGNYNPEKRGLRIPGGRNLDHLSLVRFSPICITIILVAGLPAVLTGFLGLDESLGEIIKWSCGGLAILLLLFEGMRRFRGPATKKGKQKD